VSAVLYKLGNWCFRRYIKRTGREGAAATLIATLAWLRTYAEHERLDFPVAVTSSRRRGTRDFEGQGEAEAVARRGEA
jgi:hypothetical protein